MSSASASASASASLLYAQSFGNLEILLVFSLIVVSVLLSKFLKLDLEKDFVVASLRTGLQLIGVGYVLRWVLQSESLWVNIFILLVMTLVAAQAITSRLRSRSWKLYGACCLALFVSVWPLGFLALLGFFDSTAIHQSLFFIPFMGVLMGNSLSALSLAFIGLERIRKESILEIETAKSLGASGLEACQRLYREVLRSALTPILNGMTIVGIVSLPGVMAGQLIGGVDPLVAARFQILVMFLILLTAFVGSLAALFVSHTSFMPVWLDAKKSNWILSGDAGSKLVLRGRSGAGKSRLLKSMMGLDETSLHKDIQTRSEESVFSKSQLRTQYLGQKAYFSPGTVDENLKQAFQFKAHRGVPYPEDLALSLVQELGFPPEVLQNSAYTLSGGEAQLIHLVRALLLKPQVLFLDEPTSSLDTERTQVLENFLEKWVQQEDHRLIMVTHNPEQVTRFASSTLVLSDGRLCYGST